MTTLSDFISKAVRNNPDIFGEALRQGCFDGSKGECPAAGPYNLVEGFEPVDPRSDLGQKLLETLADEERMEDNDPFDVEEFLADYPGTQAYSNGLIHIAWYWDGDGTLLFVVPSENIAVINSDCKKDYGWRFVDWED